MSTHNFRHPQWTGWSVVFGLIALWTLSGAVPGFLFPEWTYQNFFGHPAESQEVLDLFRGSWGQTLLFGVGYAFVALDPARHGLIAMLGGIGKVGFSVRLLVTTRPEDFSGLSLLALGGDLVFAAAIFVYVFGTGQFLTYFGVARRS